MEPQESSPLSPIQIYRGLLGPPSKAAEIFLTGNYIGLSVKAAQPYPTNLDIQLAWSVRVLYEIYRNGSATCISRVLYKDLIVSILKDFRNIVVAKVDPQHPDLEWFRTTLYSRVSRIKLVSPKKWISEPSPGYVVVWDERDTKAPLWLRETLWCP